MFIFWLKYTKIWTEIQWEECILSHCCWLPSNHEFKKKAFNNKVERDPPRKPLNKEGGFQLMESIENKWGEK